MSWAVAVCLARTRVMAARERQRDRQLPAGGTAGGKARRPVARGRAGGGGAPGLGEPCFPDSRRAAAARVYTVSR
jgi:hypothetical protein